MTASSSKPSPTPHPTTESVEERLVSLIEETVDNPLDYVICAFDWGHGDLANEEGPDEWQREMLSQIGKQCLTVEAALQMAVGAGHGVGKSALVSWLILWAMSTRPHLNGVVTANTKNQLSGKTWRELALWHKRAINAHWFTWTATKFHHTAHPDTWFVQAVPWSKNRPEAFAGLHAEHVLMIFDEASAIEDVIWETAEGAMTTPGAMWFCFGNTTRNTGRFRECWGRFRHRWQTWKIDSRSAKKANRKKIDQWIEDYGEDSDYVRVRVKGEFPRASSTQFISSEYVEAAMARDLGETPQLKPILIGVDVARFGDDQSVILIRYGDELGEVRKFRNIDTVALAGFVAETINREHPAATFVDGTGLGAGVVDQLKATGYKIIDVVASSEAHDKSMYANLRAEMWGRMRDWIKHRAKIPHDDELRDDLIGVEYGFNNRQQILLESKDEMKARGLASPDIADALALTFAKILPVDDAASRWMRRKATTYSGAPPGGRWGSRR